MKILGKRKPNQFHKTLINSEPGDCIQFKRAPNPKHAANAIFLVLHVPTHYIEKAERRLAESFRIMVANLETGDCSLVPQDRSIRFVDAEVRNNEL